MSDPGHYKVHLNKGTLFKECNPKFIEGDGINPIVEFTDSENSTYLIESWFYERGSM